MDIKELIPRINELAQKKRTIGLTADEQAEQAELYSEYLSLIREQVKQKLDVIEIIDSPYPNHHLQ